MLRGWSSCASLGTTWLLVATSEVVDILESINPLASVVLIHIAVVQRLGAIVVHHQADVLSRKMRLQVFYHLLVFAIELGPDLDSEHALSAKSALVKESDSRDHICVFELSGHDAEHKLVPDGLQEWQV